MYKVRNVSLINSIRLPIHIISSVDKSRLSRDTLPPFHQRSTTVSLNLLCLSLYTSLYVTNCFPVLTASQKDIYQGLCISSKSTPLTTTNLVDWVALDVLKEYCLAISFVWMDGNNSFYFFTEHSAEYDSKSQSLAAKEVVGNHRVRNDRQIPLWYPEFVK